MSAVGALTAAKIVGETAGTSRFDSEAAFTRDVGIVPVPVWSGATKDWGRLTMVREPQLNAAVHPIAVTQIRLDGPGKTYHEKKEA